MPTITKHNWSDDHTHSTTQVRVRIGDTVEFKYDVEQSGVVVEINDGSLLTVENEDGFDGGYIGGLRRFVVDASDCWTND